MSAQQSVCPNSCLHPLPTPRMPPADLDGSSTSSQVRSSSLESGDSRHSSAASARHSAATHAHAHTNKSACFSPAERSCISILNTTWARHTTLGAANGNPWPCACAQSTTDTRSRGCTRNGVEFRKLGMSDVVTCMSVDLVCVVTRAGAD